jgi:hypothetical protein
MTRSWRPGLRVQVLLAGVAAVLVVVLASAAATAWYFMDSQYKAHHSRALAIADGLAVQLERILALDIPLHDLEGFDAQCDEALARHGGLSYALVADLQGQLLFRSDRAAVAGPGMPSKVDLNEPHQHAFSADESEHPVSSPVRGADGYGGGHRGGGLSAGGVAGRPQRPAAARGRRRHAGAAGGAGAAVDGPVARAGAARWTGWSKRWPGCGAG